MAVVLAKLSVLSLVGAVGRRDELAESMGAIPGTASRSVAPSLAPVPRVVWGRGGASEEVPATSDLRPELPVAVLSMLIPV
jgi:hypothetical protein